MQAESATQIKFDLKFEEIFIKRKQNNKLIHLKEYYNNMLWARKLKKK